MKKTSLLLSPAVVGFIVLTAFVGLNSTTKQNNIAQSNPTYEQTVDFITKNIKGRVMYPGALDAHNRTEGYHLEDVKIDSNGRIEFITYQLNKKNDYKHNFNIVFNIFDLVEATDYPDGIRAYNFLVHFNGLNVSSGYGITFATDADAIKVARAFRHLKTLCNRDNDLFSQLTEDEEKKMKEKERERERHEEQIKLIEKREEARKYIYAEMRKPSQKYFRGGNHFRYDSDFKYFTYCSHASIYLDYNAVEFMIRYNIEGQKGPFERENHKCRYTEEKYFNYEFHGYSIVDIVDHNGYLEITLGDKSAEELIRYTHCEIGKSKSPYSGKMVTGPQYIEGADVRNTTNKVFIYYDNSDPMTGNRLVNAFNVFIEEAKEYESEKKQKEIKKHPFDD